MAATMTTAALAEALSTDTRTLRKFLRSAASGIEGVGKGARYDLPGDKRSIAALGKRFTKWDEARKADKEDTATTEVEAPEADTVDA